MSEKVRPRLGAAVTARLGLFAATGRAGGLRIGVGELLAVHRALAAVDAGSPRTARDAARAVLCSRRADLEVFDVAWDECFGVVPLAPVEATGMPSFAVPRVAVPGPTAPPAERKGGFDPLPVPAAWSEEELLRDKDFALYSEAERAMARALMARLAARGPRRLARRTRPTCHRGERHDVRATLRTSLRHGGEPIERRWRERAERARPLVLVCDVSGSMERYSRMLLQYLQVSVIARRRVEAFVFGTRLTRVTRELSERDPDRALSRATAAVVDFSGGTRIGTAISELNREHGRRVGRGAVVIVLSDGWDRGDPELLGTEMARLSRCAHALVWLNPLKADPRYEPLTRGMQAALPHVDHLLAGNSLRSLAELADLLDSEVRR